MKPKKGKMAQIGNFRYYALEKALVVQSVCILYIFHWILAFTIVL